MKIRSMLTLIITLSLLLTACGGQQTAAPSPAAAEPAEEEAPAAESAATEAVAETEAAPVETEVAAEEPAEPLRIAVLMPSSAGDMAWSQSMITALTTIQEEMGGESALEMSYTENVFSVPDASAAIRDYASQGYDIVIGHGSQFGACIQEIAPEFPETTFAWGSDVNTFGLDNVYSYAASAEQGGYVSGIMAAMLIDTKTVGVTGPVDVGDNKTHADGFVQGIAAVDPEITVSETWTGSFSDVALMTEAAKTHIAAGAGALTGTSQSVVGSIGAAKEAGDVLWFFTQCDQSSLAPEQVVGGWVYDWTGILREIIANRDEGILGGEAYYINLENGGLKMVYNPDYALPEDVKAAADAAIESIISGEITVEP